MCHSNRNLARVAQLQALRLGVKVVVAKDGKDLLAKAKGEVRPDVIVLSNDLTNPTTDEIVRAVKSNPQLIGTKVIVLNSSSTYKALLTLLASSGPSSPFPLLPF